MTMYEPAVGWGKPSGSVVAEVGWNLLHLIPTAILVFIMSVPSEALAYAEYLEQSHQPLIFMRDPNLADHTVGGLMPRASTIRSVLDYTITPGTSVRVLAFAYSSDSSQTDTNPLVTASGAHVSSNTLAANFLPLGTEVRVGETTYTVLDRMNERYNDKYVVDIWQPSHADAISWGARVVEIEIVSLP